MGAAVIDGLSDGLGRRQEHDPKSESFPLRAMMEIGPSVADLVHLYDDPYYYHRTGPILDQGATGTCVGHGGRQYLSSARMMTRGGPSALDIYRGACLLDPWPQNDNGDLQFGTSVLAMMKFLQQLGRIESYHWTWKVEDMDEWLRRQRNGVLVVGTNWYRGMQEPKAGLCSLDGRLLGGHCYVISGSRIPEDDASDERFRIVNSHGLSYGQSGRSWISFDDMQRLLDEDGECCAAVERYV